MNMISFRSSHHLSVNLGQLSSVMEFLTALALDLFYTLCDYSASPGCYKYATYADDSQIYTPLQTEELLTAVSKLFNKSNFFRSNLDPLLLSKSTPNKGKTTWLQESMALTTLEVLVLEAFRIAMFPTPSSSG